MTPPRFDTRVLGKRAIALDVRIDREKGDPLVMHAIVVPRGLELIPVMSIAWQDVPNGAKAWERIRDGLRTRAGWVPPNRSSLVLAEEAFESFRG